MFLLLADYIFRLIVSNFSLANHLVMWIIDFLTDRSQRVLANGSLQIYSILVQAPHKDVCCLLFFYFIYR